MARIIDEIHAYREEAARNSDFERTEAEQRIRLVVKLDGVAAVNPVNGREIPIFVSDYVLMAFTVRARFMAVGA